MTKAFIGIIFLSFLMIPKIVQADAEIKLANNPDYYACRMSSLLLDENHGFIKSKSAFENFYSLANPDRIYPEGTEYWQKILPPEKPKKQSKQAFLQFQTILNGEIETIDLRKWRLQDVINLDEYLVSRFARCNKYLNINNIDNGKIIEKIKDVYVFNKENNSFSSPRN